MFLPKDFDIPSTLKTDDFLVRQLLITDVVKDYDAVMTSIDRLKGIFGPRSCWPRSDMTFEQDLIDLGWHHKEFQRKSSFAYTVMSPDESKCLGCLYIYPCITQDYDAEVYFWIRNSHAQQDELLFKTINKWLTEKWPFKKIAYPGRNPTWSEWQALSK